MKLNGKILEGPNEVVIIIPRGNDDDIILTAGAVLSYDDFDAIVKEPVPPTIMHKGETVSRPLLTDPEYLKKQNEYHTLRLSWLMLKSLSATKGLEWDTIDLSDPSTWNDYEKELRSAGFSSIEVGRIIKGCMEANSLDQTKIDEARNRFLAVQRQALVDSTSQMGEPKSTPSGVPAKDLGSSQKA